MFEFMGIVCKHYLKILDRLNAKSIPERYIMKRWTKKSKEGIVFYYHGCELQVDLERDMLARYKELSSIVVQLVTNATSYDKTIQKWFLVLLRMQ
ncbi:Protein FAR-RED IMPAIRED RESPONSE 1 [Acorus gramineus]|uniref:Protein FAR1-RELATED SEQUENCE n=1 Tax=Acorus gramineus TaxID=55184 RepID=A0AAV9BJG9_ACOGR|nr:Protein FAR-RED IMPAIRED RESPONSE 1 [Acorus gramineus]